MKRRILFVCLGNICRSPIAEAVCRSCVEDAGLDIEVDSAGVEAWHSGNPPDQRASLAARTRGFSLLGQTARRVSRDDFSKFDLIVALDQSVLAELEDMRPPETRASLILFSEMVEDSSNKDVPDPYYTGKFNPVIDILEEGMPRLVSQFVKVPQ
ncbi:MAG: low molecular weight protein-tyrosine-phosphatase [Pseudomonadota bacterium]